MKEKKEKTQVNVQQTQISVQMVHERQEEEKNMSNAKGRFGIHGGQYIPETLMNAVIELEEAYNHYKDDPQFQAELTELPALLQSLTRSAAAFSGASTVSCTAASVSVGVYTKRSLTRLCGEVSSQTSRYRPP